MPLKIASNLSLPNDAVTQTFAVLAKRGVGKTHTASVMAEEMLKLGQPIVVYDPTGAWWGLKSSRSGKSAGFPVVVFGGEHADVPLEEHAGDTIATVIVEKRLPAILDCSLLRKGARVRFMTDFCETLYHKNRQALHFFVDEAQTIAPQNLKAMPEAARLLGAMEDIVMQGRRRGLGLTIISPRPAVVNTNLRSACEVVIAMQIIGPHDRKAIQEWVDLHGDDVERGKTMMAGLSSLKRGEAWIWSPGWLELFQRVHIRQRETFDSSATPEVGGKVATPKRIAAVDLAKLGTEIQAAVAEAKANDPKTLKARIAELERAAKAPAAVDQASIERAVDDAIGARDREWVDHLRLPTQAFIRLAAAIDNVDTTEVHHDAALLGSPPPRNKKGVIRDKTPPPANKKPLPPDNPRPAVIKDRVARAPAGELTNTQQRILDTVATLDVRGIEPDRVCVARWQGIHPNGGRYTSDLAALRAGGYLEGCRLTPAGAAVSQAMVIGAEAVVGALPDGTKAKVFRTILASDRPLSRDELAAELGIHPNGGRYTSDLAWLRQMKVITERGPIEATPGAMR